MALAPTRYTLDPSRSVAMGNLDELLVSAWVAAPISDAIYQGYVTTHVALVDRLPPITAYLVVSPTFSPNLRQRGILKDAEVGLRMEVLRTFVVVSDSATVRHAVATMSWMFPRKWALKAFPGDQLGAAATYLRGQGVRASEAAIVACVEQLVGLLPKPSDPLAE
jgi:hypothetical protein